MTRFVSTTRVPTGHGSRYATQLGKHWAHNLAVEETEAGVRIVFPSDARGAEWPGDAIVTFTPEASALHCRIDASAPGQRDGLKGAVASHLDRFAFREAPLSFDWRDG